MWKKIPIDGGDYSASTEGDIRNNISGRILRQVVTAGNGYAYVKLYGKSYRAHRLVLLAFAGEPPPGTVCCHLNGVRHDNRLENLIWGTHRENCLHKIAHGTLRGAHKGEAHHNAKLTDKERIQCLEMHKAGWLQKNIAWHFNVHPTTIHYVLKAANAADANNRQQMRMTA
jgi:hypothetical protein